MHFDGFVCADAKTMYSPLRRPTNTYKQSANVPEEKRLKGGWCIDEEVWRL